MPYGAFVEILPGKEGLLHVSEIDWIRIEKVEDVLREGDTIDVKLLEVDSKNSKMKLSHKALIPRPEGMPEEQHREPRRPQSSNDRRPNNGGGDNRNRNFRRNND